MKIKRTLRKLEIKYHTRAPHPDAPDHQLQRIKTLAKYEISKRSKKTREMAEERFSFFLEAKCLQAGDFIHRMSNKHLVKPNRTPLRHLSQK